MRALYSLQVAFEETSGNIKTHLVDTRNNKVIVQQSRPKIGKLISHRIITDVYEH